MITRVTNWRCKCGVTVKVVTETDRDRIADLEHLTAVCPRCGDKQTVLAHKILSISAKKNEPAGRDLFTV